LIIIFAIFLHHQILTHIKKIEMMKKDRIEEMATLIEGLNELLATYAVHYQNMRSMHWNVKGPNFFMLHQKFEEEYQGSQQIADEIAERILAIGAKPLSKFSDYLIKSKIKEFGNFDSAENAIKFLVESLGIFIDLENRLLEMASELKDEGTVGLMAELISGQEKNKWMFSALIS